MGVGSLRDGASSFFSKVSGRMPGWRAAAGDLVAARADAKRRQAARDKARREGLRQAKARLRERGNRVFAAMNESMGRELQAILAHNARVQAAEQERFRRAMAAPPGPVVIRRR